MISTIYTLATILCTALSVLYTPYVLRRLKEEGYTYDDKKSLKEKIIGIAPYFFSLIFPVVHLIVSAGLILALKSDEYKEEFYQAIKGNILNSGLLKGGPNVDNVATNVQNSVKVDTKVDETEKEKEAEKEAPVRTYQDAQALWHSQHEKYASTCPTLPTMDEINNQESNNQGYQKSIGGR